MVKYPAVQWTAPPRTTPNSLRLELAALAIFVALAVLHTWPLASAPGTYCRNDNADTILNEWALAWTAHALVTRPLHLFDANIFYPERRTLAFSEHMFPQAVMAAPVRWLGGSPVLAYSLALLAGFVLTGWAFSHLVYRWTGNWSAGLVAGSLAAFNAHAFTRLGHLQAQHVEFLPLALLALDEVLRTPRLRTALSLGWWTAVQALTSGYFLVFTAVSMMAAVVVRAAEWAGRRRGRTVLALAAAALFAAFLLAPFIWPYLEVKRDIGIWRPLSDARRGASFGDYLATSASTHWPWSQRFWHGTALFPGFIGMALALTAIGSGVAFKDARARMCLAIAALTFCLSFGLRFPLYALFYRALPFFQAVRETPRFGQYTLLALAVLGGFGAAWWLSHARKRWLRATITLLLLVVIQVEAWHVPIAFPRFAGPSPIHRTLAGQPGPVAYFPFYSGPQQPRNAGYMLDSTANWLPMLNGLSGFAPPSFLHHAENLGRFPDARSMAYLRGTGVRFVVVDMTEYSAAQAESMDELDGLRPWARDARVRIYSVQ